MTTIANKDDFLKWIKICSIDKNYISKSEYTLKDKEILEIKNTDFLDIDLTNKCFSSTEFKFCTFEKCKFKNTVFESCLFERCKFINCDIYCSKFFEVELIQCLFESCKMITDFELSGIITSKLIFKNCREICNLQIDAEILGQSNKRQDISFINSDISESRIKSNKSKQKDRINFIECFIQKSSFYNIDFSESIFEKCTLSLNQLSDCILSQETFVKENEIPGEEFNSIDIRTIINSSKQNANVLECLFGINHSDIKDYLIDLTLKIEFQSIFISYSFTDKEFANKVNNELERRGIFTFLWEKDAPAGKPLKEIMTNGIKSKDRILFIASEHSLKSEACHYELTQGRKKQEKTWEDVLFPIHIDNYLFEITKDKIRPKESQDEYWKNIEELKSLNSIDFSNFININIKDNPDFEEQIFKLIKGLRKKK